MHNEVARCAARNARPRWSSGGLGVNMTFERTTAVGCRLRATGRAGMAHLPVVGEIASNGDAVV